MRQNDLAIDTLFLLDMNTKTSLKKKYSTDLRSLTLSPLENPLLEPQTVKTRRKMVKSRRSED